MSINSQTLFSGFSRYSAVGLSLMTVIVLITHPVPFCFDCEFPDPWGHHDNGGDSLVLLRFLLAPFLSGLLVRRHGWLVPVVSLLALLMTQRLGGVPAWSLVNNEGPVIVIWGPPAVALCFGIGRFVRLVVISIRAMVMSRIG